MTAKPLRIMIRIIIDVAETEDVVHFEMSIFVADTDGRLDSLWVVRAGKFFYPLLTTWTHCDFGDTWLEIGLSSQTCCIKRNFEIR